MLHLEPRVHLEEVELAALDDELHGPCIDIAHRARARHGSRRELLLQDGIDPRSRALLDELLVTALDRALALVGVDAGAVPIAEDLDLDVPRRLEIALDEEGRRPECGLRPALGGGEGGGQPGRIRDAHHADAAAASGRLEHDGIADPLGDLRRALDGLQRPVTAGDHRDPRGGHEPARLDLVAHLLDHLPRRPDEREARGLTRLGEAPVLRQESVAGVDGRDARGARGVQDALRAEVAVARRCCADEDRLVGLRHVRPGGIGLGVHGHRPHPEGPARPDDPAGDFSAIGDEDAVQHEGSGGRGHVGASDLDGFEVPAVWIRHPAQSQRDYGRGPAGTPPYD